MKKPKLMGLDIVRAIAILAVLNIHATADATIEVPWGSRSAPFYIAVNTLSDFAVPVFILISGLVLFYRYGDSWDARQALSFYRKRLQYILIPYLVWSFLYYIFYQWLQEGAVHVNWNEFVGKLWWADTAYHLYFMIIIMQFYAIFPLLMSLVKKLQMPPAALAVTGIAGAAVFYSIHHWVHNFEHYASLMPTYLAMFCVGGAIGMRAERFLAASGRLWWTLALAMISGFAILQLVELAKSHMVYPAPVYMTLFNAYAIFTGVSLIWIAEKLLVRLPFLSKVLTSIGAASFGIYFAHPALLSYWRKIVIVEPTSSAYFFYTWAGWVLILAVPWLVVSVVKRWKASWLLFGK